MAGRRSQPKKGPKGELVVGGGLKRSSKVHVITPEDSENEMAEGVSQHAMDLDQMEGVEQDASKAEDLKVWLPGMTLEEGERLEPDMSVYVMLQEMQVEWPCLSFDVLREGPVGMERLDFPMTASVIAGTQADRPEKNKLLLMKWTNLRKNQSHDEEAEDNEDENEESDSDSDSDNEQDVEKLQGRKWMPKCHVKSVMHDEGAGINRIRALQSPDNSRLVVASWSERGRVYLWDLSDLNRALEEEATASPMTPLTSKPLRQKAMFTVTSHREEGFALDWSSLNGGARLLTGDCAGSIYLTNLDETGRSATINGKAFTGHSASVEDLQWSPSESTVFASCSADQTVRIWDIRSDPRRPVISAHTHESDVNVISWNQRVSYLLASGADDGTFKTWDLRNFSSANPIMTTPNSSTLHTPVATFKWHLDAITSIQWHPTESSILAVSGADDQVSLWDFAVERDAEEEGSGVAEANIAPNGMAIPPHLLFVHQGQQQVKELHWHPHSPGTLLSTAASGFNIFKTISI